MRMSEETSELFTAISKMQGELENANKSSDGNNYKYADLAECINTLKAPLFNNNLAIVQMLGQNDKGTTLNTIMTHSSGQYIGSEFLITEAVLHGGAGKNPAQCMGASITYMRRYAYASIAGLAQEDNDAKDVTYKKAPTKTEPMSIAEMEKEFKKLAATFEGCKTVEKLNQIASAYKPTVDRFNDDFTNSSKHIYTENTARINKLNA